jgi:hypothetical protein
VNRILVGEVAPFGDLHRIDLTDQVGDRHIGSRQLFAVALLAADPVDLEGVAVFRARLAARLADRLLGMVVNGASLDYWDFRIEEGQQSADDARLCLPALSEEHHVVSRQDRVLDLGDHAVFEPDDPGKNTLFARQHRQQVVAHFFAHRAHDIATASKVTKCVCALHAHPPH